MGERGREGLNMALCSGEVLRRLSRHLRLYLGDCDRPGCHSERLQVYEIT